MRRWDLHHYRASTLRHNQTQGFFCHLIASKIVQDSMDYKYLATAIQEPLYSVLVNRAKGTYVIFAGACAGPR